MLVGFIALKTLNYLTLSVPDEGYFKNASCRLNLISTSLSKLWFQVTNI